MRGKDWCNCEHTQLWREAALDAWDELSMLAVSLQDERVRKAYDALSRAVDADSLARDEYVDTAREVGP